jgi:hypothetical protein
LPPIKQFLYQNEGLRIGASHQGIQVPYLPEGWKAYQEVKPHDCEIVSPILQNSEGLSEICYVIPELHSKGHRANRKLYPLHIHVGFYAWDNYKMVKRNDLRSFVEIILHFQEIICQVGGFPVKKDQLEPSVDFYMQHHFSGKFVNITNIQGARKDLLGTFKPTVEFRRFYMNYDVCLIIAWIQMALGLVYLTGKSVIDYPKTFNGLMDFLQWDSDSPIYWKSQEYSSIECIKRLEQSYKENSLI